MSVNFSNPFSVETKKTQSCDFDNMLLNSDFQEAKAQYKKANNQISRSGETFRAKRKCAFCILPSISILLEFVALGIAMLGIPVRNVV